MTPTELQKIKDKFQIMKGKRTLLTEQLVESKTELSRLEKRQVVAEKARAIIQMAAKRTQENLQFHMSHIVSVGLAAVFPNPYKFVTEFVTRRNQPECDMYFDRDGLKVDPVGGAGGGAADITGFTTRSAYWSLDKLRNCLILDEPFKFVSIDLQARCSEMIKMMSDKLELQILMVSHLPEINQASDQEIRITQSKEGVSKYQTIKEVSDGR